jgi:hypothetical protein
MNGSTFWAAVSGMCIAAAALYSVGYAAALRPLARLMNWTDYLMLSLSGARVALFLAPIIGLTFLASWWARTRTTGWWAISVAAFAIAGVVIWLLAARMLLAGHDDTPAYYVRTASMLRIIGLIMLVAAPAAMLILAQTAFNRLLYVAFGAFVALVFSFAAGDFKARHDKVARRCSIVEFVALDSSKDVVPREAAKEGKAPAAAINPAGSKAPAAGPRCRNIILLGEKRVFFAENKSVELQSIPEDRQLVVVGDACSFDRKTECSGRAKGYCPSLIRQVWPLARCEGKGVGARCQGWFEKRPGRLPAAPPAPATPSLCPDDDARAAQAAASAAAANPMQDAGRAAGHPSTK